MRKLAIGAAAMLSTVALAAGSAGAQPAPADAGIAQQEGVVIDEVAAELSGSPSGGFVELINSHSTEAADVSGWRVTGCTDSSTFTPVTIPDDTEIPAGGFYLIGDADYNAGDSGPLPHQEFAPGALLEQAAGGVLLQDATGALVDEVMWGPDDPGVSCAFTNAGVLPTDTESIQLNTTPPPTWCALPPGTEKPSC